MMRSGTRQWQHSRIASVTASDCSVTELTWLRHRKDNVEGLRPQVALLKKAKLDDRLSEFFPPAQRGIEQVNAHFKVRFPSFVSALNCRPWAMGPLCKLVRDAPKQM